MAEIWHGTPGGYTNHACRCEGCKAAHRRYHKAWREERRAAREAVAGQLIAPLSNEFHGLASTYNNHGCRCRECVRAKSDLSAQVYGEQRRNLRKAA